MSTGEKRNEIWWLARGSSSSSRQPSFAPATARPSVTISSYAFGWNRAKSCFVTSRKHDPLTRADIDEYPCERKVALCMLWLCGRGRIVDRFFGRYCSSESDNDIFVAAGYLFGVSLSEHANTASLHFYSPAGHLQRIHLHHGMTADFKRVIGGVPVRTIYNNLR